jgi:hypothetical protein
MTTNIIREGYNIKVGACLFVSVCFVCLSSSFSL